MFFGIFFFGARGTPAVGDVLLAFGVDEGDGGGEDCCGAKLAHDEFDGVEVKKRVLVDLYGECFRIVVHAPNASHGKAEEVVSVGFRSRLVVVVLLLVSGVEGKCKGLLGRLLRGGRCADGD